MEFLTIIGSILGAILLGALGSGLWERVIGPAFDAIYRVAIRLAGSIYSGYIDNLYRDALYDIPNFYQMKIAGLLFFLSGGLVVYLFFPENGCNWLHTNLLTAFKKGLEIGFYFGAMLFSGTGVSLMSRADYLQRINAYSMKSMEILRPYIGEEAYIRLRSDCFQVTSRDGFMSFNDTLKEYADKHQIQLPGFKPI